MCKPPPPPIGKRRNRPLARNDQSAMNQKVVDIAIKAQATEPHFDRLAESAAAAPWFGRVGRSLTPAEVRDLAAYLGALELGDRAVTVLSDWHEASLALANVDWRHPSWRLEADLQSALFQRAVGRYSSSGTLLNDLTVVTERVARLAGEAVARSIENTPIDPALVSRAAGAAAQVSHQMALAEVAAAPTDHAFAAKFRLFAAGRWPIGANGQTFAIF